MGSTAVRTLGRLGLRSRWVTILAVAALGGVVAGIGLACLAGAQRTATLFERALDASDASDLEIDPGTATEEVDGAVRAMPEVESASYWTTVGAWLVHDGAWVQNAAGAPALTTDGRFLDQDRAPLRAGRHLDPERPDEVMVNQLVLDELGVGLGDELEFGIAPMTEDGVPAVDAPERIIRTTIVGVLALPEEVVGAELDAVPMLFLSPAAAPAGGWGGEPGYLGYSWYGLRLHHGEADVEKVVARWERVAAAHNATLDPGDDTGKWLTFVRRTSDLERTASRAVRPMVVALTAFGLLAAGGAVVLVVQALVRVVRLGMDELRTAQVLGLTSAQVVRASLVVPGVTLALTAFIALVTAVALSSRFPVGPYRLLEPDPGRQVDGPILIGGIGLVLVVGLAVSGLVAWRQARLDVLDRGPDTVHRSLAVSSLARAGAPPVVVSAARLTFEPGRGRTYVPTRLTMASIIVTVGLLMTTLVFGSNLRDLSRDPQRYGWTADGLLMLGGGYSRLAPDEMGPWLDDRRDVDGWQMAGADRVLIDGRDTPAVVFGPGGGTGSSLEPVLTAGHAPRRGGEVVLGRRTMAQLDVGLGDRVRLGAGRAARSAVVSGVAVFPEVGPVIARRTRLDDGVWAHPDDIAAFATLGLAEWGPPYNMLLFDLAPGASRQRFVAAFGRDQVGPEQQQQGVTVDAFAVLRPIEVSTAATASRAQSALVAVIAAIALVSLFLTLLAVVRRRRRDLAVLSALGFTPGQLRGTVLIQGALFAAVGLVVGVPLGVAAGRLLWLRFARALGVVPDPTLPVAAIGVTAVLVLAAGALSSLVPAAGAGRAGTARSERVL